MTARGGEDVWRTEAPHVLAALLRRSGDFAACEDAVQEALVAASQQWPTAGVPDHPRGWLVRVASRRLIDRQRSDGARRDREQLVATDPVAGGFAAEVAGSSVEPMRSDDTLHMLVLCAHPALSPPSQVALTLRAVAGLSTAQIAAAFLVPEPTMAQRIVRAKAAIADHGISMPIPDRDDISTRISVVRHVLYLVFNEGYTASSGAELVDIDLAEEALRLAHLLHRSLRSDSETAGLLALMLLTHARTPARIDQAGELVPLAAQDRTRWDLDLIDRGTRLIEQALPTGRIGPFQLQAAIAAVHAEAATAEATDWPQIVELYRMLERIAPSPAVSLNSAVAIGMSDGAEAGIVALRPLLDQADRKPNHRVHAAHAHLLELTGNTSAAVEAFGRAATLTNSIPEQRYLNRRARELVDRAGPLRLGNST